MPRTTLTQLREMKNTGEKIAMLTAYDATFSHIVEQAEVDVILVGDSLGMVIQGQESTIPVTVDDMVYHTKNVVKGSEKTFIISDLPFMSYTNVEQAITNAARLMAEGGAQMVKLEGGEAVAEIITQLASRGIPVCAHLGLLPQSVHRLGGYRVQGREPEQAEQLIEQALLLEKAGADMLVLECVPASLGKAVTEALNIPVIGIGAGVDCDGQVLVIYDMLGLTPGKKPRFSQNFLAQCSSAEEAIGNYVTAVKARQFPTVEQQY